MYWSSSKETRRRIEAQRDGKAPKTAMMVVVSRGTVPVSKNRLWILVEPANGLIFYVLFMIYFIIESRMSSAPSKIGQDVWLAPAFQGAYIPIRVFLVVFVVYLVVVALFGLFVLYFLE